MVGMFMMQAMAIYPSDRIHVDRERVVHDGDGLHEPFSVVERTVSDSQMKNVSQIQAAKKPAKDKITSAHKHSYPRSQMSWGGVHTSQHVSKNNQIACDVVNFHGWLPVGLFKQKLEQLSNNKIKWAKAVSAPCINQTRRGSGR